MVSKEERDFLNAQAVERKREADRQREIDAYAREEHERTAWLRDPEVQAAFRDIEIKQWGRAHDQQKEFEAKGCFCTSPYTNDGGMTWLETKPKKECRIHGEEARRLEQKRGEREAEELRKRLEAEREQQRYVRTNWSLVGGFLVLAIIFFATAASPGLWAVLGTLGVITLLWRLFS